MKVCLEQNISIGSVVSSHFLCYRVMSRFLVGLVLVLCVAVDSGNALRFAAVSTH